MTDIELNEDGTTTNGAKTFTVSLDGSIKGKKLTKVEAIMTLWSLLDIPVEEWDTLKGKLHRIED